MSVPSGIKLKGFIKKGQKIQGVLAPPEIRDIQPQQEEFLDKKPSVMTTAIKQMFTKATVDTSKTTKPIQPTAGIKVKKTIIPKLEEKEEVGEKLEVGEKEEEKL